MQSSNELTVGGNENAAMRNKTSRDLYDYWNRIRRDRFAPWRSEIEPADIHTLLPDVFILEAQDKGGFQFRLAGTRICAVYRRELKGQNFFKMWSAHDREGFETLLHNISHDGAVGIVTVTGSTDRNQFARFEMIIMPLRHHDGKISRFIGAMSCAELPYWLGVNPIVQQTADAVRIVWPEERPDFLRQAVNQDTPVPEAMVRQPVRHVRHLAIYDGGRGE